MIAALAALMLQAAGPAPAAPPPPPPPPRSRRTKGAVRARANLASLFSDEDYPAEAMRNRESGTTGFRLQVGTDGLVSDCTIVATSGSASLDSTTCRLLTERARFSPARNRRGQPVADSVIGRITWRIPETDLLPRKASMMVETKRAFPSGEVSCSAIVNGAPREIECLSDEDSAFVAQARASGKTLERTVVTTLTPAGEVERADREDHGTLRVEVQIVLDIAPDGSLTQCRLVRNEVHGPIPETYAPERICQYFQSRGKLFDPASEGREARSATMAIRGYTRP